MFEQINQEYDPSVPIDAIKPYPTNPRKGDADMIVESIRENGFYGAIGVQRSTVYIVWGNHRYLAAKLRGAKTVPVLWLDIDDARARKILAVDNRSNDLAGYNDERLAELLQRIQTESVTGLMGAGYNNNDLEEILANITPPNLGQEDGSNDPTEITGKELLLKWGVETGQVWAAGSHRLMCGDSLSERDVLHVLDGAAPDIVFADPPIHGGDGVRTAVNSALMCLRLFPHAAQFWWGGNYFASALPNSSCWIAWEKIPHADCDLAWTNQETATVIFTHQRHGVIKAADQNRKPVALAEWCYEKYGEVGDVIFDPFAGSHMSAVAAENTGRSIRCIEMSPEYVAVGLQRLEDAGLQPTLLS